MQKYLMLSLHFTYCRTSNSTLLELVAKAYTRPILAISSAIWAQKYKLYEDSPGEYVRIRCTTKMWDNKVVGGRR